MQETIQAQTAPRFRVNLKRGAKGAYTWECTAETPLIEDTLKAVHFMDARMREQYASDRPATSEYDEEAF